MHSLQRSTSDNSTHAAPLHNQSNFVGVLPLARYAAFPHTCLHNIHSWVINLWDVSEL